MLFMTNNQLGAQTFANLLPFTQQPGYKAELFEEYICAINHLVSFDFLDILDLKSVIVVYIDIFGTRALLCSTPFLLSLLEKLSFYK